MRTTDKNLQIFIFMLAQLDKKIEDIQSITKTLKGNPRFDDMVFFSRGKGRYAIFDMRTKEMTAGYDGIRFYSGSAANLRKFFFLSSRNFPTSGRKLVMSKGD